MLKYVLAIAGAMALTAPTAAQSYPEGFTYGPVFEDFGPVADVDITYPIPEDVSFRHSFDVATAAAPGEVSRGLESAARFINMNARAGVPVDRIQVAIVVHGRAGFDLMHDEAYAERNDGAENANLPLIAALIDHGVQIILCGQSAAGIGIENADLAPGVRMALSAMTAHAILQQQGYTVNPF